MLYSFETLSIGSEFLEAVEVSTYQLLLDFDYKVVSPIPYSI